MPSRTSQDLVWMNLFRRTMYHLLVAQILVSVALSTSIPCQKPSDTQLHNQWMEHMENESQSLMDVELNFYNAMFM